jgi:hypothetical protein
MTGCAYFGVIASVSVLIETRKSRRILRRASYSSTSTSRIMGAVSLAQPPSLSRLDVDHTVHTDDEMLHVILCCASDTLARPAPSFLPPLIRCMCDMQLAACLTFAFALVRVSVKHGELQEALRGWRIWEECEWACPAPLACSSAPAQRV